MRINLLGIRTLRTPQGVQVQLVFRDDNGGKYAATYPKGKFLIALDLISNRERGRRLEGLAILSILPGMGKQDRLYFHRFPDGFTGNLGDLGTGAANELMLMLHENAPRAEQLRAALIAGRRITLANTFLNQ